MSHAAKQIRDWFVATLGGLSGFPDVHAGAVAQTAAGAEICTVSHAVEAVARSTVHAPGIDQRDLDVVVTIVASSLNNVDAHSAAAEAAIATTVGSPAGKVELVSREYQESVDTDRVVVSLTLNYIATYDVARSDVETIL